MMRASNGSKSSGEAIAGTMAATADQVLVHRRTENESSASVNPDQPTSGIRPKALGSIEIALDD